MDHLKLRIWDIAKEKFITDTEWLLLQNVGWYFDWHTGQMKQIMDVSSNKTRIIEGLKFSLFTGQKDINGVEVYEGDILKMEFFPAAWRLNYGFAILLCEWQKEFSCFSLKTKIDHNANNPHGWALNNTSKCEKIGNIYENPELLNLKK